MRCPQAKEEEQQAAAQEAVFPVILQILQNCIFNTKDPIVLGCSVEEGIAKVCYPGSRILSGVLSDRGRHDSLESLKLQKVALRHGNSTTPNEPGCWTRLCTLS